MNFALLALLLVGAATGANLRDAPAQATLRVAASTPLPHNASSGPPPLDMETPGEGELVLPDNTVVHTFTAKTLNVGNLHIENDEVMSGSRGLKLPATKAASLEVEGGASLKGYTQLGVGAPSVRLAQVEAKLPTSPSENAPPAVLRDAEGAAVTHQRVVSVNVVLIRENRVVSNWSPEGAPYFR